MLDRKKFPKMLIGKCSLALALAMGMGMLDVPTSLLPTVVTASATETTADTPTEPLAPRFSHGAGFYADSFYLTLSAELGQTIHFTTDGSRPTRASQVFASPIYIHSPAPTRANSPMSVGGVGRFDDLYAAIDSPYTPYIPNLYYNAMVVRAMAVDAHGNESPVATGTFFVDRQGRSFAGTRVISLAMEPEHFVDPVQGMYRNWNRRHWPLQEDVHDTDGPRHIVYFEMFDPAGQRIVAQYTNAWVFGNWSRQHTQRSLRFNFNQGDGDIVGMPEFIPDTRRGFYDPLGTVERFRHINARTSDIRGDGRTGLRDPLVALISEPLRPMTQNSMFGAVFINGEFWGMYDLRAHRHEQFIAQMYGVPAGQVQLEEWAHGFMYYAYFHGRDMTAPNAFDELNAVIDMDSLIDYFIIGVHFDNNDWIGNNFEFWRTREVIEGNPFGDGRWRFVVQDFDESMRHAAQNTFEYFTTTMPPWSAWAMEWFPMLFENETFRNTFAARYATYLGTVFHPQQSLYILDNMVAYQLANNIGAHLYRFSYHNATSPTNGIAAWQRTVNDELRHFLTHRPQESLAHMRAYFNGAHGSRLNLGLDASGFTNIHWRTNPGQGWLDISGAQIRADLFERQGQHGFSVGDFRANYLRGLPIEVTAMPLPGRTFSHFEVTIGTAVSRVEHNPMTLVPEAGVANISVQAVFEGAAQELWGTQTTAPMATPRPFTPTAPTAPSAVVVAPAQPVLLQPQATPNQANTPFAIVWDWNHYIYQTGRSENWHGFDFNLPSNAHYVLIQGSIGNRITAHWNRADMWLYGTFAGPAGHGVNDSNPNHGFAFYSHTPTAGTDWWNNHHDSGPAVTQSRFRIVLNEGQEPSQGILRLHQILLLDSNGNEIFNLVTDVLRVPGASLPNWLTTTGPNARIRGFR